MLFVENPPLPMQGLSACFAWAILNKVLLILLPLHLVRFAPENGKALRIQYNIRLHGPALYSMTSEMPPVWQQRASDRLHRGCTRE